MVRTLTGLVALWSGDEHSARSHNYPGGRDARVAQGAAIALSTGVLIGGLGAPIASANPAPPTNGGNGAGQSGQCTGAPADRPAVCPGT